MSLIFDKNRLELRYRYKFGRAGRRADASKSSFSGPSGESRAADEPHLSWRTRRKTPFQEDSVDVNHTKKHRHGGRVRQALQFWGGWVPSVIPSGQKTAVEFRHITWDVEQTFEILQSHQAAYCVTSGANLPCVLRATANFVFVRLHGPDNQHTYAGTYSENDLRWWAARIGDWRSQGRDVYAYFNNDGQGHAVRYL